MTERLKVLIVLDDIHLGGISKSLLNYLPHISAIADCDLLIFNYSGLDRSLIPAGVRVMEPDDRLHILGMSQSKIAEYSSVKAAARAALVLISRLFGGDAARNILLKGIPNLSGYDLAISYSQDVGWKTISTGCNHFVLDKVQAKYKAAFIHCDYANFGGYDIRQEASYSRFDSIVCVSNACKASFVSKFPRLEEKCVVCENFTNTDEIHKKLENGAFVYDDSRLNIVTVCRLSEEKGILRAAEAVLKLVQSGRTGIKWTIVGGGPEKDKIDQFIEQNGLQEYIELVGSTANPYYYLKNADVFLLPSYHEAAPMVFGECHALGLPIISTDTISAKELVEDRGIGKVCPNSTEGIANALMAVADEKSKPPRISQTVISQINLTAHEQMQQFLRPFAGQSKTQMPEE